NGYASSPLDVCSRPFLAYPRDRLATRIAPLDWVSTVVAAGSRILLTVAFRSAIRQSRNRLAPQVRSIAFVPVVSDRTETNGALIDATRARALADAGLDIARVQLVAWGDAADE